MAAYSERNGHEASRVKFHRRAAFIAFVVSILNTLTGHGLVALAIEWVFVCGVEELRHRSERFHVWLLDLLLSFWLTRGIVEAMRPEERDSKLRERSGVLSSGTGLGTCYVLLEVGLLSWGQFLLACAMLAFVDPEAKCAGVAAALRGKKHALPAWVVRMGADPKKSIEGFLGGLRAAVVASLATSFLAFVVASVAATIKPLAFLTVFGEVPLFPALVASIATSFAELFGESSSLVWDDNCLTPLTSGTVQALVTRALHLFS